MARAKRTERADARRRYRAATIPDGTTDSVENEAQAPMAARSKAPSAPKPGSSAPTERVGFVDAFKLSIRPLHVRDDIAALPSVALHSRALWVPVLITIVSAVTTAVTGASDIVTGMLFTYFVVFPAVGGVFLAGFLAPRASWLVGVIVGVVSALCYILLGLTGRLPAGFSEQFNADTTGVAVSALIYSPILGGFFAAAAAWYRRFLALSSPNRGRRGTQGQKGRPGDGRTRAGSTSQKAGAKR